MTVDTYIRMNRIDRFRITYNGRSLYDSTLTTYVYPQLSAESMVMDTHTTKSGITVIEI